MATTLWLPAVSVEVDVLVAVPPERVTGAPKLLSSTRNCTVPPVGVPVAGGTGATVAVKVTAWPVCDGFRDDATVVVVAAAAAPTVDDQLKSEAIVLPETSVTPLRIRAV